MTSPDNIIGNTLTAQQIGGIIDEISPDNIIGNSSGSLASRFALILKGKPWWGTVFTRTDEAFSIGLDGEPIEVQTDIPTDDISSGVRESLWYVGINLFTTPDDFTDVAWTKENTTITDGETLIAVGSGLNRRIFESGITVASGVEVTVCFEMKSDTVSIASTRLFAGVGENKNYNLTSEWVMYFHTFTSASTSLSCQFFPNHDGTTGSATDGDSIKIRRPLIWEGSYCPPYIPIGNQAVNQGSLQLPGENIDKASYLFNGTSDCIDCNAKLIPATADFEISAYYLGTPSAEDDGFITQYKTGEDGRFALWNNRDEDLVRLFIHGSTPIGIDSTTSVIDGNPHKISVTRVGDTFSLYIDDVLEGTQTQSGISIYQDDNTLLGCIPSGNFLTGYMWDAQFKGANGDFIEHYELSQYRRDTLVKGEYGNNGTSVRTIDNLISENDAFGYPVNLRAPTLNNKTVNEILADAGTIIFRDFKTADISSDIVLLRKGDGTPVFWIENTTGLLKLEDDSANIATSIGATTVDVYFTFWIAWIAGKMWITLGTKGAEEEYTGIDVGNRLLYTDSGILHRVEDVCIDDIPQFAILVDGEPPVFDGPDQNIEYI